MFDDLGPDAGSLSGRWRFPNLEAGGVIECPRIQASVKDLHFKDAGVARIAESRRTSLLPATPGGIVRSQDDGAERRIPRLARPSRRDKKMSIKWHQRAESRDLGITQTGFRDGGKGL